MPEAPGQGRKNNAAGRHVSGCGWILAMPPIISRAQADDLRRGQAFPSLYLPAAVYATDNARFARQIIAQGGQIRGRKPGFSGTERGRGPGTFEYFEEQAETPLVERATGGNILWLASRGICAWASGSATAMDRGIS